MDNREDRLVHPSFGRVNGKPMNLKYSYPSLFVYKEVFKHCVVCERCGSIVFDRGAHSIWHRFIEEKD